MKSTLRSCAHKVQHTRADALALAATIRKAAARAHNKTHSIKVYRCGDCGAWHLGHDGTPKRSNYKRIKHFS